jgi:hypothetical protein
LTSQFISSLRSQLVRDWLTAALDDVEGHLATYTQMINTSPMHCGDVDEQVLATIIWPDEAETSFSTVPFHSPARHARAPIVKNRPRLIEALGMGQPQTLNPTLTGKVKPQMRLRALEALLSSFNDQ